jgi:hypothetical protein
LYNVRPKNGGMGSAGRAVCRMNHTLSLLTPHPHGSAFLILKEWRAKLSGACGLARRRSQVLVRQERHLMADHTRLIQGTALGTSCHLCSRRAPNLKPARRSLSGHWRQGAISEGILRARSEAIGRKVKKPYRLAKGFDA